MQVRCPQCLNPQMLEIRLAAGDTKRVNCSECAAVFSVRAKSASSSASERSENSDSKSKVEQPSAETPHWQVRKPDGTVLQFPNLSLFQTWQSQGIISEGDQISRNGHQWRALTDIPELIGLFDKNVSEHPVQANAAPATPPPLPSDEESEPTDDTQTEDTQAPQTAMEQEAESTAPETTQPIDESSKGEPVESASAESTEDSADTADNALHADPEAAAATGAPPPMTFEASAAELSMDPSQPRSAPGDAPVIKPEEDLAKEPGEDSSSSASDLSEILKQAQELPIARSEAPPSRKGGSRWLTVALILMLVATMSASAYVVWQRNMDPPEPEGQIFGDPLPEASAEAVPTTKTKDNDSDEAESTSEATQKPEAETQEGTDSTKPEKEDPSAPPPENDTDRPAEEKAAPTTTDKPAAKEVAAKDMPSDDKPASPSTVASDTDDMETMPDDDEPEEPAAEPPEPPPSDPATYRGLMSASKVALKRKPSRALVYARKAMERNPRSVAPIARMGWAYLRMGDTTNAIIQFDRARNMNPGYRDTYRGLGQSYEQAGRKTDAITAYERYLAMCGNCSRAKKILKRLDGLQRTL